MNNKFDQLNKALDDLKKKYGDSIFWDGVKKLKRKKLEVDNREKRKHFPLPKYQDLWAKQCGICPICEQGMDAPFKNTAGLNIDHKNPNREKGFNDDDNLQLTHGQCNMSKSSKSLLQQSKETGKTMMELLEMCLNYRNGV